MRTAKRPLLIAALLLLLAAVACSPISPVKRGDLAGRVLLDDGGPVGNAVVRLYAPTARPEEPFRETRTDGDGAFSLERVPVGEYNLSVASASLGAGAFERGATVSEGEITELEVEASEVGQLTGVVALSDGAAPRVRVYVPGSPYVTETASGGEYALRGVPEGGYDVVFEQAGYGAESRRVSVVGGETVRAETVTLVRRAPYAAFRAEVEAATVTVDATASESPASRITEYRWEFGDGTTFKGGPVAVHTYASSGRKRITLTVKNAAGYADSVTREVNVRVPQLTFGRGPFSARIPARSAAAWEVLIPAGLPGDLLYFEVAGAESIRVTRGGETYSSSGRQRFTASPRTTTLADPNDLSASAIRVGRTCRGPCVILPNSPGSASLLVNNGGSAALSVTLYLEADRFDDTNEPNDTPARATPLYGNEVGALELIGDLDWFQVMRSGRLLFTGPQAFTAEARVRDGAGKLVATLSSGDSVTVQPGYQVEVRATSRVAGPGGASFYSLEFE